MTKFVRLLHFEWNRIFKFLIGFMIFIFVSQLGSILYSALSYKNNVITNGLRQGMSPKEIVNMYSEFSSFHFTYHTLFILPMGIGIGAILFYIFFIWYRDWLGKNNFIYRLLMLPISRMKVYLAKLTTILLAVLSLVTVQYLFLYFYEMIIKLIIPEAYRMHISPIEIVKSSELLLVLPPDGLLFIFAYLAGTLVVMLLFTLVLLERSYKLVGIAIGVVYIAVVLGITIGSFVYQIVSFNKLYFYPGEMTLIYIVLWFVFISITFFWNRQLMKRKITV